MTADEKYQRYVSWMRLTHGGRRLREDMPLKAAAEWDAIGFEEASMWDGSIEHEAIRQTYLAAAAKL